MITIYGSKRSSAFRCIWLMEELGVPYEVKILDMAKGENKTPEYLKLNPNGKIPTLVDDGFVLWESMAINYYLLEKYEGVWLVGTTAQEHAQVNQWNFWFLIHLYEAFHPLVMQVYRKLPDSEATKRSHEELLPRYLKVLEDHLSNKEYMVLERFTLADLTGISVVKSAAFVNYDLGAYPHIRAWMEQVMARPAYQKLLAD